MSLGKRARMRKLARKALLPIPEFRIHFGPGPAYKDLTYFDPTPRRVNDPTLFWQGPLRSREDVRDFLHECGHAFDFRWFSDADRARATVMLTDRPRAWFWDERGPLVMGLGPDPVCEVFADAFAEMCRSPRRRPRLRALVMEASSRVPS